jgi:PAS domain S-box-containing protein
MSIAAAHILRRAMPPIDTPLRLYLVLLGVIFLADLLQDTLFPVMPGGLNATGIGALATTVCGAPLLWFLVVRPLKRVACLERSRIAAVRNQVIDAIVMVDRQGVVSSLNASAERIFGHRAEEIVGASAAVLLEDGRPALERLISGAGSATEPTARVSELTCRRRDGLTLVVEVSVSQLRLSGRQPEYLLIMRDITGRKEMEAALRESELRFREIFQQSEEAILFVKPGTMEILDANANAERMLGAGLKELRGDALARLCLPDDLPRLSQAVAGIGEGRTALLEFRCRRGGDERMTVQLRGKRMLLKGVPVGYCTLHDVTERIRLEERTRDIQARLIQTNKMTSLGLLVSGVAHEINNPNNFIMANVELLSRLWDESLKLLREYAAERPEEGEPTVTGLPLSELEEQSKRLFEGISVGSRRVNDIVRNLKGFARQDRRPAMCEVDVNEVARSAVSLLHHELIKYTDNFHLQLAERPPLVMGHGQQLGQVIINLLMNACQALPGKTSGIWLATACDPQERLVIISVRDEGRGISREECQRIMEPFFTTRLDAGGTGLGLSISESIVREHGGTLEFQSTPGEGSLFQVRLPVPFCTGADSGGELLG